MSKPVKGVVEYNEDGTVKNFQMIEPAKTEEEKMLEREIENIGRQMYL